MRAQLLAVRFADGDLNADLRRRAENRLATICSALAPLH
jgi:hypothetical protein